MGENASHSTVELQLEITVVLTPVHEHVTVVEVVLAPIYAHVRVAEVVVPPVHVHAMSL